MGAFGRMLINNWGGDIDAYEGNKSEPINDKPDDTMSENESIEDSMDNVGKGLQRALKNGLAVEVVVWALNAMKLDNSMSINQAFNEGLNEWDC